MTLVNNMRSGNRQVFATGLLATVVVLQCASVANGAENATTRSNAIVLTPCNLPGLSAAARCGTLEVPENPATPGGRRLQIGVAVIPATGVAQTDPIVPLMGGPGEEAIRQAAYFA